MKHQLFRIVAEDKKYFVMFLRVLRHLMGHL